jgi:hypothetical protein
MISGPNDFWFVSGSVFHWDGVSSTCELVFSRLSLPDPRATIDRLWGSSRSALFGVGHAGSFVRYDGTTWQSVQAGTDVDLNDVYGTGSTDVWIAGLDMSTGRSILLHWDGSSTRTAYSYTPDNRPYRRDSLTGPAVTVWASDQANVWVETGAVYLAPASTRGKARLLWEPPYLIGFIYRIRGNAPNNVFEVGDFATIIHFNGSTWHHYREFMDFGSSITLRSVAISRDRVFIVGGVGNGAIVFRGRAF